MAVTEVGYNYAQALIDSLRSPEEIDRAGRDLSTLVAVMKELPALTRVLDHPGLSLEKRSKILDDALDRIDPHPTTRRFLHVVLEKGRVRSLPEMQAAFIDLRDARLDTATAEVVTAAPVDAAAKKRWEETLSGITGKKVNVTYRTDRALIGGALTRVGSVVYDGSVRKQISRIRDVLLGQ